MDFLQSDGFTVRRDPDSVQYLLNLLRRHAAELRDVQPALQEWGFQAVHFNARLRDSGVLTIVKVGMSSLEAYYVREVGLRDPALAPQTYASGDTLGDASVNWAAFERIPYGPMGPIYQGREFGYVIRAGVRFQQLAREIDPAGVTTRTKASFLRMLERGVADQVPGPANDVIDDFSDRWDWLASVCPLEVCHGDLHLCNGLTRVKPPQGPVVLIDFSPIWQPWCFDAAYLQALTFGDRLRRGHRRIVQRMAEERAAVGLPVQSQAILENMAKLTVGWFAIAQWQPERQEYLPDYESVTQQCVAECAEVSGVNEWGPPLLVKEFGEV